MIERPYVVLSCAMSVDGHIDDAQPGRLLLSNAADLDRVDSERARCDAVMVGAETVRRDDPRLLVRSAVRRAERASRGLPANPAKVTLTASGDLDPRARFFTTGPARRIVYCAFSAAAGLRRRLGRRAQVVAGDDRLDVAWVLGDLARRGVRRLLVEGGGRLHTQLLVAGLADELQLVVAPFFVGESAAPRFVDAGVFAHRPGRPMRLTEVRQMGDLVLLRYRLGGDGREVTGG